MSLAQVASGEVSRTAVFLAETGKTRPTLPTIQLIAARTGKPVEYFLEDSEVVHIKRPDLDKLRGLAAAEKFADLQAAASAAKAEAVDVAGELKDLSRLGKMYGNLGGAYEHLGDLARARAYSQKSIAIHELLNDQISVARAENNLGLVLMRQGELDQAREHLDRALRLYDEAGVEVGKGHLLLSLAELELNGRDPDGARRFSLMARDVAHRHGEL